jgi:hypothetical protein
MTHEHLIDAIQEAAARQRPRPEIRAARVLWRLYPGREAFVRRVGDAWSAEVVTVGQVGPPYRTVIVAEAATAAALLALLEARL